MVGNYNIYLVIISIIIAIIASYSALNITSKISNQSEKSKLFWIISGSVVMGAGVWSMHFIGMLAFHSHATVEYDILITILSMVISVLSSFIAFFITMSKEVKWYKVVMGGFIMGSGIAAMHYMGMEAMIMEGEITYNSTLVVLSIIIALCASYIALLLFTRFRNKPEASWLKWLSAIIMGMAVSGMHYTGMDATIFTMANSQSSVEANETNYFLLIGVIASIFMIIIILWIAMFFERYVLEKLAYQDNITGLANRNKMMGLFNQLPPGKKIGIIFIDLDRFKLINDTLGHDMGDLLLEEIGAILKKFKNQYTQVFRIGGDEFLFILDHADIERMKEISNELLLQIKEPIYINGNGIYITGSIGIAGGSAGQSNYSELLRAADTAMYVAKRKGKNQYCVYTEEMGIKESRRMKLEQSLQQALEERQFILEYQPKWDVKADSLFGFEALARWNHPELGRVSPYEFIPIAEETGFIVPFTQWTLEEACKQCKMWHAQGIEHPVSVNLSPKLFQTDQLYELIKSVLQHSGLDPAYLELEITESMMLHDVEYIIKQLRMIHSLGVKISIDDFGTGYSSIGLLDTLPIDAVKLDRVFTKDIDKPSKQAIVQAIIILAESLELDVIAEGVELEKDIEYLTKLGCFIMQGYYYSKPIQFQQIKEWMNDMEQEHI